MRSGQYRTINAAVVYEGELISRNRFTGEMVFDEAQRTAEKIAGYVAYFRLLNGFEKWYYMTLEEVQKHGKRYSKSFSSEQGKWRTDFDAMALKTVLKMMLSKYGILSIEMQTAVQADQAIIKESGDYEYPDNLDQEGQDQPQSTADAIKGKLKQAKKPVEAPTPIETDLSPGPCPDNPSVTYTLSHCDACPTRQGCPAFDDSSGEPV